jgi:hypothetical protein
MKIVSQEYFDSQGIKIKVIEPESRGAFQDYIDEQRHLDRVRKAYNEIEEYNRKSRIAFGLELYDPEEKLG